MPDSVLAHQVLAQPAYPDLDTLMAGRVHEAVGPGRIAFALGLAGQLQGAVIWVGDRGRGQGQALYPPGLAVFMDPARLYTVHAVGAMAVLQITEEALRSGAAPLVVAELHDAPDLTASRRLQLAAGTGGGRGLCLIPEGRLCNNAAETRWMCMAMPGGHGAQQWEAIKSKRGRLLTWQTRVCDGRFVAREADAA